MAASVADKGPQWERRCRTLTARTGADLLPVPGAKADDEGFRAVNQAILDHARGRLGDAEQGAGDPEELGVVAVTHGRRAGEDDTEAAAESAAAVGHLVLRLDPTQSPSAGVTSPRPEGAGEAPDAD
ncbi:hypothetical protein ABT063_13800 [Streptomyces sp. NPDC002838]|uniref:hypothetical protein n=1 Tax=Streptomyces sp. NPDC002838 TaxID=3154436 RepID=UPI0033168393